MPVETSVAAPPVFAALADETRWAVLVRIGRSPASASVIAAELPVSRQAVAKHLEVLERVGLATAERHGREVRYAAVGSRLTEVARDLARVADGWQRRLERIRSLAERPRE